MKDNPLIGKTITAMKIADDKKALLFIFGDEQLVARVDADCCSDTWIESIELPTSFPATVYGAEGIELNTDLDTRDGEMAYYGFKLSTDKGDIVIDYRNESNGYYGGNICFGDNEYFYGGVYGQNISTENWIEITDASLGQQEPYGGQ